jgi:hypothetical protein
LFFAAAGAAVVTLIKDQGASTPAPAAVNLPAPQPAPAPIAAAAPSEPPAIRVFSADLVNLYHTNGVDADLRYLGKLLDVSGSVRVVDKLNGQPYVELAGEDYFRDPGVTCLFRPGQEAALAPLRPGRSTIIVRGNCRGRARDGNVLLSECHLAP